MFGWFKKREKAANDESDYEDEELDELEIRSAKEVAERLLSLIAMVSRVHEEDQEKLGSWINKHQIENYFSDEEKRFFYAKEPEQNDLVNFSWRAEAAVSLFWALNIINEMPPLNEQCGIFEIEGIGNIINNPYSFIQSAQLRSDDELKEKESDLYHQHWRVRDAQLFQKEMPDELNPSIVYERRYALSWVVGWGEDDWDDVPTDT